MQSAATGSPKLRKRSGSPLALSSSLSTWGAARSITRARSGRPASSRRHLSPPLMRRDCPPARSTPQTSGVIAARPLAIRLPRLVFTRKVGIKDDSLFPRKGDEAAAPRATDQGQARLARQFHPPGREARTGNQDGNAHLHRLDHHFGGEAAGGVEDLVGRLDALEQHVASNLVDRIVSPDILHVDQGAITLAEDAAVDRACF